MRLWASLRLLSGGRFGTGGQRPENDGDDRPGADQAEADGVAGQQPGQLLPQGSLLVDRAVAHRYQKVVGFKAGGGGR